MAMEKEWWRDVDIRDLPPGPLFPSPMRYRFERRPPLRERIAAFVRRIRSR